jgi:hypothetical protein
MTRSKIYCKDCNHLSRLANHDGVLDLSYAGPDQTSPARPFRFWANDDQDSGDFGGNYGVPGYQPYGEADGNMYSLGFAPAPQPVGAIVGHIYSVHGRRDLVDFFPVYLNIGSLFQSNALSAGINPADTNYQFVLSQADGALRFVYTSLTPTNYMNYLRDINVSSNLANAVAWQITPTGIPLLNSFAAAQFNFLNNLATNNGGIILVEAATNTTQPLVLTIYHGTNQIAQTSLSLSISGVEQMFRSKTMMLNSTNGTVPDRLRGQTITFPLAGLGLGQNGIDATPVESRISLGHLSRDQPWGSAERCLLRCHCDDADRQDFLKTLAETCQKAGFQIRACCLIDGQGSDKMRRLVEKLWFDPFSGLTPFPRAVPR